MIPIKTPQEIEIMRQGGKILAEVLDELKKEVKPGVKTEDLNRLAEGLIFKYGAAPAFKGFKGRKDDKPYPAALCVSVNEEIVHALPSERILKNGDVVSLDLGVLFPAERCATCPLSGGGCGRAPGLYTDAAITLPVGRISGEASRVVETVEKALELAIEQARSGKRLGDISFAVQSFVESCGLAVIRDLSGHGVGRELHEEPDIPNFGQAGTGPILKEGMTLALEPMVSAGSAKIKKSADGFGYQMADGSLCAHFEHTILVSGNGAEILTKT